MNAARGQHIERFLHGGAGRTVEDGPETRRFFRRIEQRRWHVFFRRIEFAQKALHVVNVVGAGFAVLRVAVFRRAAREVTTTRRVGAGQSAERNAVTVDVVASVGSTGVDAGGVEHRYGRVGNGARRRVIARNLAEPETSARRQQQNRSRPRAARQDGFPTAHRATVPRRRSQSRPSRPWQKLSSSAVRSTEKYDTEARAGPSPPRNDSQVRASIHP